LREKAELAAELDKATKPQETPSKKIGRIIYLNKYLADRIQSMSFQLEELDKTISVLMNDLICEKDQAIARRLQRKIGRLDARHSRLHDQLRMEKRRYQRYFKKSA
jgi:hypothetical protein